MKMTLAALAVAMVTASGPAMALTVTMSTLVQGDAKPVIVGQTNLPDGTKVMATISRKASSFMAQDNAVVFHGSFQVGPFSQHGENLNPGTYNLDITTPMAALQSPEVQAVIGDDGSKIAGPLVKPSKYGGNMISYSGKFKVGNGASSPAADEAERAKEKVARHQWWLESCQSNCALVEKYSKKTGQAFDLDKCHAACLADEP